jgi:4-methylaminobutanoate oxidase (formaldehyde-forming)
LTVANADAPLLFDALQRAGGKPLGHYALEGCRLEKGFRHWGHELGPKVTPLEAGLGFTIDWDKDFAGKAALAKQSANGLNQRLVLMQVEGEVLLLHDEPIFSAGQHVGLTTSGGRGPRTGLNLCFAMLQPADPKMLADLYAQDYTVLVAGQEYKATPLPHPPFDPKGERMRA